MTRDRASFIWPAMKAFAEHKPVQARLIGATWEDYTGNCPDFQNENWEWRVKPEPREWWVAFGVDRMPVIFRDFDPMHYKGPLVDFIRVREVLE